MRSKPSLLTAALVALVVASGCGHSEKLISQSGPTPQWVTATPSDTEAELRFKGLSLADNVLDEAVARSRALADARRQIAAAIETHVNSETTEYLERQGYEARGRDITVRDELRDILRATVAEDVRWALERDHYYVKWEVDEGLFHAAFVRYKYFVLVGYPREEYERQRARFVRLETERALARQRVLAGNAGEAVALLVALVRDYPSAAVSLRLQLADAYVTLGRLDLAESLLDAVLSDDLSRPGVRHVRGRLTEIRQAFPDVQGKKLYVLYDPASDLAASEAHTLIADVASRAGLEVVDMERGAIDALDAAGVRRLFRLGVDWVLAVRIEKRPVDQDVRYYDVVLHPAAAECTVRLYGPDGAPAAARTAPGKALLSDQREATMQAAQAAFHAALRGTLITVASNGQ